MTVPVTINRIKTGWRVERMLGCAIGARIPLGLSVKTMTW
jgi:hypothetical protein